MQRNHYLPSLDAFFSCRNLLFLIIPINHIYKCLIRSDASFLEVLFYCISHSELLTLTHSFPWMIVFEKKIATIFGIQLYRTLTMVYDSLTQSSFFWTLYIVFFFLKEAQRMGSWLFFCLQASKHLIW
jgi:hypothetical protein